MHTNQLSILLRHPPTTTRVGQDLDGRLIKVELATGTRGSGGGNRRGGGGGDKYGSRRDRDRGDRDRDRDSNRENRWAYLLSRHT